MSSSLVNLNLAGRSNAPRLIGCPERGTGSEADAYFGCQSSVDDEALVVVAQLGRRGTHIALKCHNCRVSASISCIACLLPVLGNLHTQGLTREVQIIRLLWVWVMGIINLHFR